MNFTCYDRNARPRHYMPTCERQYSWGTAKEDYVLPDAHTVQIRIAPEQLEAAQDDATLLAITGDDKDGRALAAL